MAEVKEIAIDVTVNGAEDAASYLDAVDEITTAVDTATDATDDWTDALSDAGVIGEETASTIDSTAAEVDQWNDALGGTAAAMQEFGSAADTIQDLGSAADTASVALSGKLLAMGKLLLIALAVAAVAYTIYWAWESNFLGIRDVVTEVTESIVGVVRSALDVIRGVFQQVLSFVLDGLVRPMLERLHELWAVHGEEITTAVRTAFDAIRATVTTTTDAVLTAISTFVSIVTTLWSELFGPVLTASVLNAFTIVKTIVATYVDGILTTIRVALALLRGDWEGAWDLMAGFLERSVERFRGAAEDIVGRITDVVTSLIDSAKEWGEELPGSIADGIRDALSDLTDAMRDLASDAAGAFRDAFNDATPSGVSISSGSLSVSDGIGGSMPSAGSASIPGLRHGGYVDRGGLARLHAGEMVVPAADVSNSPGSPPAAGGASTTVVFESGAIQVGGGRSSRRTAEKTADEISKTIRDEFGARR